MSDAAQTLSITSEGEGLDLVLLHGWGLHSEHFAPWLPYLTPQLRVHRVDLPGHGLSPMCVPFTLERMATAVVAAMQPVATRFAVCGWSLGGMVAQRMAMDFPDVISHVVALASSPKVIRADDWLHAATPQVLELLASSLSKDYAGTLAQFFELNMANKYRPMAERLHQLTLARPAVNTAALTEGVQMLVDADLRPDVSCIRAPLLAISGRLDRLNFSQSSAWLASACDGQHIDLRHSAHTPHLSEPEVCAQAVLRHLGVMA